MTETAEEKSNWVEKLKIMSALRGSIYVPLPEILSNAEI